MFTRHRGRPRRRAVLAVLTLVASLAAVGLTSASAAASLVTGNLLGWGFNYYGYVGNGSTYDVPAPGPTGGPGFITQVSAGSGVLALADDGTVYGWGRNDEGQLGNGATSYRELTAVRVQLPPVIQIAEGGNDFGIALDGNGTVYSFGRNYEGELGRSIGGYVDPSPTAVPGLPTTITSVSAGGAHSLARTADGHVWAWGWNQFGQLGDPTKYATTYPAFQVTGLTNVVAAVAAGSDSYALDTGGAVWAWGWDYGGPGSAPAPVSGLPAMASITAGLNHAVGLDRAGNVWAWGSNQYGQVGDGGPSGWRSPVELTSLTGVAQVSAAGTDSFAIGTDGTLWSWGSNWFGQLGDGTATERHTPVLATGVSDAAGVSTNSVATLVWRQLPASSAAVGSIGAAVTPDSPLYAMTISTQLSTVACPASITVTVSTGLTRSKVLCPAGGTAPSSTNLNVGVLPLAPDTSYPVTSFINDAFGVGPTATGTLTTPPVPVLVAVGDSYTSGHHQDSDEPCTLNGLVDPRSFESALAAFAANGTFAGTCIAKTGATSLLANDIDYSWVSQARDGLMSQLGVPARWRMLALNLGDSGATVAHYASHEPSSETCKGCGETDAMRTALLARAGSWNIVTVNGGANDAGLEDTLEAYYHATLGQGRPWDIGPGARYDCPDTDALDAAVHTSTVKDQLATVLSTAVAADANVRELAITYPYILDDGNVCQPDSATLAPQVGAGHAVDDVDAAITQLASSRVSVVDLRTVPSIANAGLDDIQQTRYYGYPHLNAHGQADAAAAVVDRLLH